MLCKHLHCQSIGSPKEEGLLWAGANLRQHGNHTHAVSCHPTYHSWVTAADAAAPKHPATKQLTGQGQCMRGLMSQLERGDLMGLQNG